MMYYVSVAINVPLPQVFTYSSLHPISVGVRVLVSFRNRKVLGFVTKIEVKCPDASYEVKSIDKVVDSKPLFDQDFLEVAHYLAVYNFVSLGEMIFTMTPSGKKEKQEDVFGLADEHVTLPSSQLTSSQRAALETIELTPRWYYLFGATGSGKTEVFMRLIAAVIAQGGTAIYLVPEIALAQQTQVSVRQRFNRVAVLHSGLTPSQRLTQWRAIQNGQVDVVVGARSAIFAPLRKIKLIIIDEEHDTSYKAGSSPRYHARQVAMFLAKRHGATLVMGSATPSAEAYHAMKEGIIQRVDLHGMAGGGRIAPITLVDMRKTQSFLSAELIDEIFKTKAMGKQTALFLNRRGFARFYLCPDCGYEAQCTQCAVALTWHKAAGRLCCHYCGFQQPPPSECPSCQSFNAGYSSFGLEKVEEEVQRIFSGFTVVRLDGERAKIKGEVARVLALFKEGKADILLGTQMAAKGFNFPHLRLVGITLADVGLGMPDFRATERTFSFLRQVAGRAGRYSDDGLVIAQTYRPNNSALRHLQAGTIEEFYEEELAIRHATGFPPFSRLIRLVYRGKSLEKVVASATQFAEEFEPLLGHHDELLGPIEASVSRITGFYRYQVLLKTEAYSSLKATLDEYLVHSKGISGVYRELEGDPLVLM